MGRHHHNLTLSTYSHPYRLSSRLLIFGPRGFQPPMSHTKIQWKLLILVQSLALVHGFSSNLVVSSIGCMTGLDTTEVIMNQLVKSPQDSDFPNMHLAVVVDENHMESPFHYHPKEGTTTADVAIAFIIPYNHDEFPEANDLQFVIQVQDMDTTVPPGTSAEFVDGGTIGCDGNQRVSARFKDNDGQVQLQIHDVSARLKLWAGWATGQNAVRLTPTLILEPAPLTEAEIKKEALAMEEESQVMAEEPGNLIENVAEGAEMEKVDQETVEKETEHADASLKKGPKGEDNTHEHVDELPEQVDGGDVVEDEKKRDLAHKKGKHKMYNQPKQRQQPETMMPNAKLKESLTNLNAKKAAEKTYAGGRARTGDDGENKDNNKNKEYREKKPRLDEAKRRKDLAAEMERNFPDRRSFRARYHQGKELSTSSHIIACIFFILAMGLVFFIISQKREKGRRDL